MCWKWEPYQVSIAKLEPSIGIISPVLDLYGWQKHSGKADQPVEAVNMNSYLIIAISWGNKMNFSLYVNMAGFCSDSHIFHAIN